MKPEKSLVNWVTKLIIWILKLYHGDPLLDPIEGKWQSDSHPQEHQMDLTFVRVQQVSD